MDYILVIEEQIEQLQDLQIKQTAEETGDSYEICETAKTIAQLCATTAELKRRER